jgi:molecular chaperone GrpE
MTGTNQPGHGRDPWDPESDGTQGSHPAGTPGDAEGAEPADGADLGPDYAAHGGVPTDQEDDQVADGEIFDAAEVSAAVDEAFADDDPLSLALNQRDEYLDSLRRLQAEFENYKKRVAKQQLDQMSRAAQSLVSTLLPVLDTLDLAIEHLNDADSADGRALVAVAGQLNDVLTKAGLERLHPVGEQFDPTAHEAVGHLPADEGDPGGGGAAAGEPVVGQVMRAGYRWNGAVIRPAMVMVKG